VKRRRNLRPRVGSFRQGPRPRAGVPEGKARAECRRLFARLSEYLDGELPAGICEELRTHLDGCRPCAALARQLEATVDLCRSLPSRPVPPELRRQLRTLLEREAGR
jgi:RNA polymerase sigma-70 factor (ECF subfamily)